MVKVIETEITELSGDVINGGTIKNFSSIGIADAASFKTLFISDGKIYVEEIETRNLRGNIILKGNIKIDGNLEADRIKTHEITTNQKHERQYLEFSDPENHSGVGCGLLWKAGDYNHIFVLKPDPYRFWFSDNVDVPSDGSYCINGVPVISASSLGAGITHTSIQKLGLLQQLTVDGPVNISDYIFYNPVSQRIGIGTDEPKGLIGILDYYQNIEFVLDTDKNSGYGKFGTFSTKGFEIITDDTPRISISETGNITLGQEYKDSTVVRVYGKLSVGVKNAQEQFEVAGNIKFANKLFATGSRPPDSGHYQMGDIIWNDKPRANAYVGWVCIVTGAPGTWQPFGLIAP